MTYKGVGVKTIIALVLMVFSVSLFARLGETKEDCIKRYGKSKSKQDAVLLLRSIGSSNGEIQEGSEIFLKDGIVLDIKFHDNIAEMITYFKIKSSFTYEDVAVLQTLNLGEEWVRNNGKAGVPTLVRMQCYCAALRDGSIPWISFKTIEYIKRDEDEKKAKAFKKMNGF